MASTATVTLNFLAAVTVTTAALSSCTVEVTQAPEAATVTTAPLDPATVTTAPQPTPTVTVTDLPGPERNVIVFLIDDSGREFLECYSNETYTGTPIPGWLANRWGTGTMVYPPTPNISDFAANGVVLTRFNTSATCSPTRAALLTGRDNNAHKLGNAIRQTYPADPVTGEPHHFEGTTIYSWMEQQGSQYLRLHIGKWHISESFLAGIDGAELGEANSRVCFQRPVDVGRAHYYAGGYMNWRQPVPGFDLTPLGGALANHERWTFAIDDHRPAGLLLAPSDYEGSEFGAHDDEFIMGSTIQHSLVWEVARANEVIDRAKVSGRKFLMNVWFHATHDPLEWSEGMGGAQLFASGYHSYGTSDPGEVADRFRAFTESVDHAIGLIWDNLSAAQKANTTVFIVGDNGIDEQLIDSTLNPTSIPSGGDNPYSTLHSKRAPFQGGIGSPCIVYGAGVEDPGDGTTPRFWNGLCDVQDLFYEVARLTGTHVYADQQNGTSVLKHCLENTQATGKGIHIARAFLNGYADDMWSVDADGFRTWISAQNEAGWKLIYWSEDPAPSAEVTGVWQFYDMQNDPLEATDIFDAAWTGTVQGTYNALTSGQKTQFAELYAAIVAEDLLPPGMAVTL